MQDLRKPQRALRVSEQASDCPLSLSTRFGSGKQGAYGRLAIHDLLRAVPEEHATPTFTETPAPLAQMSSRTPPCVAGASTLQSGTLQSGTLQSGALQPGAQQPDARLLEDALRASGLLQRSLLGCIDNPEWTARFSFDAQRMADLLRAMGYIGQSPLKG